MIILLRLIKNLVITLLVLSAIGILSSLIYLNQIGFPGQYGDWVRAELSKRGIEIKFDSLRYSPRQGLIATNAKFFVQKGDTHPALTADYLSIDLDKTLALRGDFELRELIVARGDALVPVNKEGATIGLREINAEIFIQEDQRLLIRKAEALVEGVKIKLDADLKLPESSPRDPSNSSGNLINHFLKDLALWKFSAEHPPELSFIVRGDLNDPSRIRTEFSVNAHDLSRNQYALGTLSLHGELRDELVTVEKLLLADDSGEVEGKADWNLRRREGRVECSSSIDFKTLLKNCFGLDIMTGLESEDSPYLQFQGQFSQQDDHHLAIKIRGYGELGPFRFQEAPYDGLRSQFSWQNGDLYLQDLEVHHQKRSLKGDLLMQGNTIRYRVASDLPLTAFSPFVAKGSPTERLLSRFKFQESSKLIVALEGQMNRSNLKENFATGTINSTSLSYRDISLKQLSNTFQITPEKIEFLNIKTTLDDNREPARTRHQGGPSEPILVDRIYIDRKTRITYVTNLRGTFWPTPIIRAFAPNTAAHLEEGYQFHQPPNLTLNGAFTGHKEKPENTHFHIALTTSGSTGYPFLGRTLPVQNLRCDVTMKNQDLTIDHLAFTTLEGMAAGKVSVKIMPDAPDVFKGNIRWDKISFPALSKVYHFDQVEKGILSGQIEFSGIGGNLRNFNAQGGLKLKNGHLVSLPVLGPLSPLMAGILGDKRMGYERAKNGEAQFEIINGVWQSKNLIARSENVILTGSGWIDLITLNMDMTIRANVRGLLGVIALPLSPFRGLIQFRGTGKFTDPNWQNANFTAPANGDKDPIFKNPIKKRGR